MNKKIFLLIFVSFILFMPLIIAENSTVEITDEEAWKLAEKVIVPIGENISSQNVTYSKSISWRHQYSDMVLVRITLNTPYDNFGQNDEWGEETRDQILNELGEEIKLYSDNRKGWIFHAHITPEGLNSLIKNSDVLSVIDLDTKTFESFKSLLEYMDVSDKGVYYSKTIPERFDNGENVSVEIYVLDKSGAFETNDNFDEYIAKKRAWFDVERENLLESFSDGYYNLTETREGFSGNISEEIFYQLLNNSEIEEIRDSTGIGSIQLTASEDEDSSNNLPYIDETSLEKKNNVLFLVLGIIFAILIISLIIMSKRTHKNI